MSQKKTPDNPQLPASIQLWQMATGHMTARAIHVAAKLGIADSLKKSPKTINQLAAETGAFKPTLHRLLRALASVLIFKEMKEQKFCLTPLAEALRSDSPESILNGALLARELTPIF